MRSVATRREGDDVSSEDATAEVAEVYRTHYRRLVVAVYAATGDYDNAQDVVQEAFADAVDRPHRFLAAAAPQAYMRMAGLNVARQRWRRKRIFDRLVRLGRVARPADTMPGLTGERVDM